MSILSSRKHFPSRPASNISSSSPDDSAASELSGDDCSTMAQNTNGMFSRKRPAPDFARICPDSQLPSTGLMDGGVARFENSQELGPPSNLVRSYTRQRSPLQGHLIHTPSSLNLPENSKAALNYGTFGAERGPDEDSRDEDEDGADEFELPPGNQLAASRAVLEVSTPASSHTSALHQLTLNSQRQERNRASLKNGRASDRPANSGHDSYDTDFGSGSLNRGRVVPSSDLEDDDEEPRSSQMDDFLSQSPSHARGFPTRPSASPPARPTASSSRARLVDPYASSIQAILTRPLPRFCQRRPTLAMHQHSTKESDDVVATSSSPEVVTRPPPSQVLNLAATVPHLEYDEEAHMRDSAAAVAEESLIVLSRPSKRTRRQATPAPDAPLSVECPGSSSAHGPARLVDREGSPCSNGAESSSRAPSPGQVPTPSPPTPPSIHSRDDQSGYITQPRFFNAFAAEQASPPRLAQRAEHCEYIQIMPWHKKLSTRAGRRKRPPSEQGPATSQGGKKKATEKAQRPNPVRGTETMPVLDGIPLSQIRPLTQCPICGLRWTKSRTGPAKRAHMELCAESPPASLEIPESNPAEEDNTEQMTAGSFAGGEAGASGSLEVELSGEGSSSVVGGTFEVKTGIAKAPNRPLTASQVHALVNRAIDGLVDGAKLRQTELESNKTLFAHLVGEEGLAQAADQARRAKEARDRERQLHLDNHYNQQGELPKDYKPRKKRKRKGKSKGKSGEGVQDDEDNGAVRINPALARLIAKRDAETAKRRAIILRERAGDGHAEASGDAIEQDHDVVMQTASSGLFPPTEPSGSEWVVPSSRTPSPVKKKSNAADLETRLIPAREGRARADAYLRELFPATQMRRYEEDVRHLGLPPTERGADVSQVVDASQTSLDDYGDRGIISDDDDTVEMLEADDGGGDVDESVARRFNAALEAQEQLLRRSARSRSVLSEGADNHDAPSSITSFDVQAPKAPQEVGGDGEANARLVSLIGGDSSRMMTTRTDTSSSRVQQTSENVQASDMASPSTGSEAGSRPLFDGSLPPATQRFRRSRLAEKYGR